MGGRGGEFWMYAKFWVRRGGRQANHENGVVHEGEVLVRLVDPVDHDVCNSYRVLCHFLVVLAMIE